MIPGKGADATREAPMWRQLERRNELADASPTCEAIPADVGSNTG
jgi:hypothetical protein